MIEIILNIELQFIKILLLYYGENYAENGMRALWLHL